MRQQSPYELMISARQNQDRRFSFEGFDRALRNREYARKAPNLPLVSIVTPAYNEECHLCECIESVLSQTYQNWDYTIVNNCSTDATLAMATKYAVEDRRIRIVSNATFVPAVTNFNIAVRQISPASKYCKMVLADDWLFPECLERMVALMEEHPSVGVVGAYGLANSGVLWFGLPYPRNCVPGREICRQKLLGGPYVFGSQTSVLYRADLVRSQEPFFDESSAQSDSEACFRLLKKSDFGFVHQLLTFSRERAGSMLTASRSLNSAAPDQLGELIRHGPYYLSSDEYQSTLRLAIDKYYDFLAASFLRHRERTFWDYHRRRMREQGVRFSRLRLARALADRIWRGISRRLGLSHVEFWGLEKR